MLQMSKKGYDGISHCIRQAELDDPDILERFYFFAQRFPKSDALLVIFNKDKEVAAYAYDDIFSFEDFKSYLEYMPFSGHYEYYDLKHFREKFTFPGGEKN